MKKHYFVIAVEEKEFVAILKENENESKPFFQMEIIDGDNFLCENDLFETILMDVALTYKGEGVHFEIIGTEKVEITYNICE